jgi:hypothetical protein
VLVVVAREVVAAGLVGDGLDVVVVDGVPVRASEVVALGLAAGTLAVVVVGRSVPADVVVLGLLVVVAGAGGSCSAATVSSGEIEPPV